MRAINHPCVNLGCENYRAGGFVNLIPCVIVHLLHLWLLRCWTYSFYDEMILCTMVITIVQEILVFWKTFKRLKLNVGCLWTRSTMHVFYELHIVREREFWGSAKIILRYDKEGRLNTVLLIISEWDGSSEVPV